MPDTPLAKKLRILPGRRVLILNAPHGFTQTLDLLPDGATIAATPDGAYDVVLAFAGDSSQLAAVRDAAIAATKPGGALWFAYPKKSTGKGDLQRESVWELVRPSGWGPVSQIALDETWSALRFKPETEVTRGSRS